jgi:hypothetical protein
MDGKGAGRANVVVDRLERTIEYEQVYLRAHVAVRTARVAPTLDRVLQSAASVLEP